MINILLYALAFVLAALLILYLFFPRVLFNRARKALRRHAGLTLRRVDVGGTRWPYLDGGKVDGAPVVLVHGFGGDKDNWVFYAPQLVDGYRIICPDLPGFGDNVRDPALGYDFAAQARRLADFLTALGIERCHLGGNSMGGGIALQFALDFPDRLRSLSFFDNAGVRGTSQSELEQMYYADRTRNPLVPVDANDFDRLMAFIAVKPRPLPGQFKKLLYADFAKNRALLDRIFFAMAETLDARPYNDDLGRVNVPTLILWGRQDRVIDVTCAEVQHAAIPESELHIFDDAGHIPMIEVPADCARVQRPFLDKH